MIYVNNIRIISKLLEYRVFCFLFKIVKEDIWFCKNLNVRYFGCVVIINK